MPSNAAGIGRNHCGAAFPRIPTRLCHTIVISANNNKTSSSPAKAPLSLTLIRQRSGAYGNVSMWPIRRMLRHGDACALAPEAQKLTPGDQDEQRDNCDPSGVVRKQEGLSARRRNASARSRSCVRRRTSGRGCWGRIRRLATGSGARLLPGRGPARSGR